MNYARVQHIVRGRHRTKASLEAGVDSEFKLGEHRSNNNKHMDKEGIEPGIEARVSTKLTARTMPKAGIEAAGVGI